VEALLIAPLMGIFLGKAPGGPFTKGSQGEGNASLAARQARARAGAAGAVGGQGQTALTGGSLSREDGQQRRGGTALLGG
jgi:hypothetical protein